MSSQSVDGISQSFQIPDRYLQDPQFSYYATTVYGQKYLSMLMPLIAGAGAYLAQGRTTFR